MHARPIYRSLLVLRPFPLQLAWISPGARPRRPKGLSGARAWSSFPAEPPLNQFRQDAPLQPPGYPLQTYPGVTAWAGLAIVRKNPADQTSHGHQLRTDTLCLKYHYASIVAKRGGEYLPNLKPALACCV